jgi:hypothetical protein
MWKVEKWGQWESRGFKIGKLELGKLGEQEFKFGKFGILKFGI